MYFLQERGFGNLAIPILPVRMACIVADPLVWAQSSCVCGCSSMVGTERVFASAPLPGRHSIFTHHFLKTIPSVVHQHQHGLSHKTVVNCELVLCICVEIVEPKMFFFGFEVDVNWHDWRGCRMHIWVYIWLAMLNRTSFSPHMADWENYTSRYRISNKSMWKSWFKYL